LKPTFDNAAAITAQVRDASAILLRLDALPAQLLGLNRRGEGHTRPDRGDDAGYAT